MEDRLKQLLLDQKKVLEISVSIQSQEELLNHEEEVHSVLLAMEQCAITAKLIKDLKLGKLVAALKNKFEAASPKVSAKCKDILINWKKVAESSKGDKAKGQNPVTDGGAISLKLKVPAGKSSQLEKPPLPKSRTAIIQIFTNSLKLSTDDSKAEEIAIDIETALNDLHIYTDKVYSSKAKTLSFNMKKNESLRLLIIEKGIHSYDLVRLTAAELATQERKEKRENMIAVAAESRRLDWHAENKEQIQLDIGIDPTVAWEYESDDEHSEPDCDPPDI